MIAKRSARYMDMLLFEKSQITIEARRPCITGKELGTEQNPTHRFF
jgi:hypothetical protein